MGFSKNIRKVLRKLGFDIPEKKRLRGIDADWSKRLSYFGIDWVLDVGANEGQYGRRLREIGYRGTIDSFEPLDRAYDELSRQADCDDHWNTHHYALGDKDEEAKLNVAGNSVSSSFLDMLPSHLAAAPSSKYVGRQDTQMHRLDTIFKQLGQRGANIYLKLDTQGNEARILEGASESLCLIDTVQIEMSLKELYGGEMLFGQLYEMMVGKGFELVAIEPGFTNAHTGTMLQVDGVFHRD